MPRLISLLSHINEASPVSSYAAARYIASDDELYDAVASYVYNPDVYDEEVSEPTKQRFLSILSRVRPIKKRLYRGEQAYEYNDWQPYEDHLHRGFTSWSAAADVSRKWFTDTPEHMVKYTDGPMKAISLSDIVYWRNVLTDESVYSGAQAEYFVLEPVQRQPHFG